MLDQVRRLRRARFGLSNLKQLCDDAGIIGVQLPSSESIRVEERTALRAAIRQMSVDDIIDNAAYINRVK